MDTVETQASFQRTHELAGVVVNALAENDAELGYSVLACALAIGRMYTTDQHMSDEEEVKFIEDLTDWVSAYFGEKE